MEKFTVQVALSKDNLLRLESALYSHIRVLYKMQRKYTLDGIYENAKDVHKELAEVRKLYEYIRDISRFIFTEF